DAGQAGFKELGPGRRQICGPAATLHPGEDPTRALLEKDPCRLDSGGRASQLNLNPRRGDADLTHTNRETMPRGMLGQQRGQLAADEVLDRLADMLKRFERPVDRLRRANAAIRAKTCFRFTLLNAAQAGENLGYRAGMKPRA